MNLFENENHPNGAEFVRFMTCWGWATWRDRWEKYARDPGHLISNYSKQDIYRFDVDGTHSFWQQVLDNYDEKIDSWDIFWYSTIFNNNGLCLIPNNSFCTNIGFDGTGIHCGTDSPINLPTYLNNSLEILYPDLAMESKTYISKLKLLPQVPVDTPLDTAKGWRRVRNKLKSVRNRCRRYGFITIMTNAFRTK